ncbi:oxidoreductase [Nissabacter sp. SGAir0207]|nr:oxidoreductase [Nissabacter sp. SGAir0207]
MQLSAHSSRPLRVAIIGAGQVAEKVHAAYYATRRDVTLVAVVDTDAQRAADFATRNNIPHSYTDAGEMYRLAMPDAVSICSPNRFHCEQVLQALQHGCHVMCEKPPAMLPHEALAMAEAAERVDRVLAYDFHHRFADDCRLLRQKVAEGMLGEVYVTHARALRRCGVPGWGVFIDKAQQGGGPLIDIGIHMLDAAMYVLGFPRVTRVSAHQFCKIGNRKSNGLFGSWQPEKYTVEDALFATLELEQGGILRLDTSFALNIPEESVMNVQFCGADAGATLFPAHIYTDEGGKLLTLYQRQEADSLRHHKSMKAFVDRALGLGGEGLADGRQGYAIQQLVAAIYQAAERGESVTL